MDKIKRIKKSLGLATALFVSVPFGIGVATAGPDVRVKPTSKAGLRSTAPGVRFNKAKRRDKAKKQIGNRDNPTGSVVRRDNPTTGLPRRDNPINGLQKRENPTGSIRNK